MEKKYIKIIVIVFVWVAALSLTYIIAKPKSDKNTKSNDALVEQTTEDNKEENKETIYKGTNIYDMYDENDLNIEYIIVGEDSYFKISGLVDTELQNKINSRIKDTFYELRHKIKDSKKGSVHALLNANFGDILSVEILAYESNKNDDTILDEHRYINISLKDGKDIDLYDLFIKKDIVNSILTREFSRYLYGAIKENGKVKSTKNNDKVEDKVFQIINDIKNGYKNFYVSNYGINIDYGEIQIIIKFKDYSKYLAFPTKYKSDNNLYKDSNIGLKTLLFNDYYNEVESAYIKHEFVSDYLYIDSAISNYLEPKNTVYRNKYIKYFDMNKIIDKYKKNINSKLFTYINISGELNGDKYGEVSDMKHVGLTIRTQVCTMTKDYFNKKAKKKIFTLKNTTYGEMNNLIDFSDKNIKCKNYLDDYVTNLDGKLATKLSDVFKDGYNYQKVLDEEMNNYLMENGIEDEKAKQDIKYSVGLDGIYIDNKYFESLFVDYSKFDEKGLKW